MVVRERGHGKEMIKAHKKECIDGMHMKLPTHKKECVDGTHMKLPTHKKECMDGMHMKLPTIWMATTAPTVSVPESTEAGKNHPVPAHV